MKDERLKKLIRYTSDVAEKAKEANEDFNRIRKEINKLDDQKRAEKYIRIMEERGVIAPECDECTNIKMYDKVRDEYYCPLCDHEF